LSCVLNETLIKRTLSATFNTHNKTYLSLSLLIVVMVAPPIAAASLELPPPFPAVFEQPMEKLTFPNEFPYEFASSTFSTSPEDSTETEDETTDDEDDFLAGLTRRLALSTQRLSSPSFVTDKSQVC